MAIGKTFECKLITIPYIRSLRKIQKCLFNRIIFPGSSLIESQFILKLTGRSSEYLAVFYLTKLSSLLTCEYEMENYIFQ